MFLRLSIIATGVTSAWLLMATGTSAAPVSLTYTYNHHIFTLSVANHPEWKQPMEQWYYLGNKALPPARFLSCGTGDSIEPGWTKEKIFLWNEQAIQTTIEQEISRKINRKKGSVIITRTDSGSVAFEGKGLTGLEVNLTLATTLTKKALENNIATIVLPIDITKPVIEVKDKELQSLGIKEVVTIGESVFAKSPVNRRHNIKVGVDRFNGHLIPQGSIFSFNEVLGPVNDKTGYRKELVIQGTTTLPDYGGGLCQVSTTAYRGPWEYGLPIVQRKNHSYAVSYYSPQGTDATIYPPNVDIKFLNNTPGALLLQTFIDDKDQAFFIYYGTRDGRKTEVSGPFISDRVAAPKEELISYTTEIPPGERRKAGERHDGMKVMWYRTIQNPGTGSVLQRFFSSYEARPLTYQIGVATEEMARQTPDALSELAPSWLPSTR